jgi:hypothetical protein
MIRRAVYGNEFMFIISDNACYVLIQIIFPCITNKGIPVLNGKYKLKIYLCERIAHKVQITCLSGKQNQCCRIKIIHPDVTLEFFRHNWICCYNRIILVFFCFQSNIGVIITPLGAWGWKNYPFPRAVVPWAINIMPLRGLRFFASLRMTISIPMSF